MSALSILLVLLWAQAGGGQADPAASSPPQASPKAAPGNAEAPATVDPAAPEGAPVADGAPGDAAAAAPAPMVMPQVVPPTPAQYWALQFGHPGISVPLWWGALLNWTKIMALVSLLGWAGSWMAASLRGRRPSRLTIGGARPIDLALLLAVIAGLGSVFVRVAQASGQLRDVQVGGISLALIVGVSCLAIGLLWLEVVIWSGIIRERRRGDLVVLLGVHLALAGGVALALSLPSGAMPLIAATMGMPTAIGMVDVGGDLTPLGTLFLIQVAVQVSMTFMGYVVLLRILLLIGLEIIRVRPRRLYAMGSFSWIESFRKMRIPWAVLAIFVVILAFTHWFLQPPDDLRQAELSRMYVGTLMLLTSFLLTVMVAVLTPISLPNDIRFQTIYTVVTKPVSRLEVVWGRMLGFMGVVTVLLLALGGMSLIYFDRNVWGRVDDLETALTEARDADQESKADLIDAQLQQLRTRLSARLPVEGSLTFLDSLGEPRIKGIDVGQELEIRSFVEGGTQARAAWLFGPTLPPPFERLGYGDPSNPYPPIARPIPLNLLLKSGSIEDLANQIYDLAFEKADLETQRRGAQGGDVGSITNRIARLDEQIADLAGRREGLAKQYLDLRDRADAASDPAEARALRDQAAALRSDDVPVQMTFTVYRTTKGRIGEPVYGSIRVVHPFSDESPMFPDAPAPTPLLRDPLAGEFGGGMNPLLEKLVHTDTFDIREYYTNSWSFPAAMLVGSRGYLTLEVQCLSPTQYLGMAEGDLFIVADQGSFTVNFMKGLLGIWLQAMVLTAIGVWAGTFLSWPVALLITVFFFVAGQLFFPVLDQLAAGQLVGGGPFESMIRMLSHENQMSELDATLGVILARSLDAIVVPIMALLIYVVPNFSNLDLSNLVADGFAIPWALLAQFALLALGYALPFSIAGYFILKNREVAA